MIRPCCYILVLPLPCGFDGTIGSLGHCQLPPGEYAYVGSARSGLDQRLQRHLRSEKPMRWHIDRISIIAQSPWAMEFQDPYTECSLAEELEKAGASPVLPGFGSSDCRCLTHLFRAPEESWRSLKDNSSGIFP